MYCTMYYGMLFWINFYVGLLKHCFCPSMLRAVLGLDCFRQGGGGSFENGMDMPA